MRNATRGDVRWYALIGAGVLVLSACAPAAFAQTTPTPAPPLKLKLADAATPRR